MSDIKNIRDGFKTLLEEESLSESELSGLRFFAADTLPSSWYIRFLPIAAAAVLFITVSIGGYSFWSSQNTLALEQRIVREVLTNHLNIKPLDFSTASMEQVQQYFDRLDFLPFLSSLKDFGGLKTLGGRYCTLQGAIALQIRLATGDGNMATYYQSRYQKSLFGPLPDVDKGESPHVLFEGGMKLQIWQEKGTVSVLAQQS